MFAEPLREGEPTLLVRQADEGRGRIELAMRNELVEKSLQAGVTTPLFYLVVSDEPEVVGMECRELYISQGDRVAGINSDDDIRSDLSGGG